MHTARDTFRSYEKPTGITPLALAMAMTVTAAHVAGKPPAPQVRLRPHFTGRQVVCGRPAEFEIDISPVRAWKTPYTRRDATVVSLRITGPDGGRIEIPAFLAQPFERKVRRQGNRDRLWIYPVGRPERLARWTPRRPGTFTCVAALEGPDEHAVSEPLRVTAASNPDAAWHGFLRTSRRDPRFFEFEDGTPFFAVGQNVAFIKDLLQAEQMISRLGKAGANFARIWVCCEDWALAVEARKSAWGRSWEWKPPIVRMPGRDGYHTERHAVLVGEQEGDHVRFLPCNPVAVRADTTYILRGEVMAEHGARLLIRLAGLDDEAPIACNKGRWTRFRRTYTTKSDQWWLPPFTLEVAGRGRVWLRNLSLRETEDGPELLVEADPDRPARGAYNQIDCFLLDELVRAAARAGVYLQLCLLTRDHYMRDLTTPDSTAYRRAVDDARNLLRYAVARWGAFPNVAAWEYFNEMNPGLPNEVFYDAAGAWLERNDPHRRLRTTSAWSSCPKDWSHPRIDIAEEHFYMRPAAGALFTDAVAAVLDRARLLRRHAPRKPALIAEFGVLENNWRPTPLLKKDPHFLHLHNALWAGALSGLSGTVMHWFWDDIDRRNLYGLYTPIARFVAMIPWTTAELQPIAHAVVPDGLETVGISGPELLALWIHDQSSTWYQTGVRGLKPKEWANTKIELRKVRPGAWTVSWFDTRAGRIVQERSVTVPASGILLLRPPTFSSDIACLARRTPLSPAR